VPYPDENRPSESLWLVPCVYIIPVHVPEHVLLFLILLDFPLAGIQWDGTVMLDFGNFHCGHGLKLLTFFFLGNMVLTH
jgi:hypothetical protein